MERIEKTIQKICFVAVAFSLWFPINTDIDAVSHISIQKVFYFNREVPFLGSHFLSNLKKYEAHD